MNNRPCLDISEKFASIQGESSYSGMPCVFFRLAGCNLRCSYCDSRYTYEETGTRTPVQELVDYALNYPGALVEITGGEPLLQENVYLLMHQLLSLDRKVLLETNGSISIERVPHGVIKIMDIKCPDSGMDREMNINNLNHITENDEIKFVISSRKDYDWSVRFLKTNMQDQVWTNRKQRGQILFSPAANRLNPGLLADWIIADNIPVRLQIQLHTFLWPGKARGY